MGVRWSLVWLAVGVRERLKKHIVIYNSMKKLYVYEKWQAAPQPLELQVVMLYVQQVRTMIDCACYAVGLS